MTWLLNVNRKDGGKFIFPRGRVGIHEVQDLKTAGGFWNADETPVATMGGVWVVSVRVMLRGGEEETNTAYLYRAPAGGQSLTYCIYSHVLHILTCITFIAAL